MKLKIDRQNDALYFRLSDADIAESEEVRPGIIVDYDLQGRAIGVEFLGIKSRVSEQELLSLQFQAG